MCKCNINTPLMQIVFKFKFCQRGMLLNLLYYVVIMQFDVSERWILSCSY